MKNLQASAASASDASSVSDARRSDSIVACRALFDRVDVDGSGTLDRNEISMLATKMVRRPLFCACRAENSILAQSPTIRNRVED